jgi:hypothetical protein
MAKSDAASGSEPEGLSDTTHGSRRRVGLARLTRRRVYEVAISEEPSLGEAHHIPASDNNVIENSDLDKLERFLELLGDVQVGL